MDYWSKHTGNELVSHSEDGGVHTYVIKKK